MRFLYILLFAAAFLFAGTHAKAQGNFQVELRLVYLWINGDAIGDGTSLPDPTFRMWSNLHTSSQSGQSNGAYGQLYFWQHFGNLNVYDQYPNYFMFGYDGNPGNFNISDGFWLNIRMECHENDSGPDETRDGGDDHYHDGWINQRIQLDQGLNFPLSQEFTVNAFSNGGTGNENYYRATFRVTIHRLDAFEPTLRYENTAGNPQNLFCSGDPMRVTARLNGGFNNLNNLVWERSTDGGGSWQFYANTGSTNFITVNAASPMPLFRCRTERQCPAPPANFTSSPTPMHCRHLFLGFIPVGDPNGGATGTSDGWVSSQGVPITVGPPPPDPNAIITNVTNTCQGSNNGAINVQVGSINSSFTYSLTLERTSGVVVANHTLPGGSTSINYTFNGLSPDAYNVKVTLRDNNNIINCTSQKSNIVVGVNPLPVVSGTGTAGACFGQNGSVTINIIQHSVGNSIQGFQLYDNSGFNLLDQFYTSNTSSWTFFRQPGTYKVRAINGNNCTSAFVDVVIPNAPSAVTAGIGTDNFGGTGNQIQCNGGTGEIRVTPSGGTPNYNISVSGGAGQTGVGSGLTATFLRPAGTYSITVTDANGCNYNPPNVTLNEPPALSVNINTTPTGVCVSTGTATFSGQGGVGPYTYRLNFSGGFNSNNNFTSLGAGDYTAFVRDATGCERSVVFTISPLPALQVSASNVTPVICFGQNTGSVTLAGTGGKAPYTYAIGNSPFSSNNVFGSLTAATYTFRVRDADFCESQAQITVSTPDALLVDSHIFEPGDCGSTIRPTVLTITGRTPGTPLEISIDNGGSWNALTEIAPQNGNIRTRLNLISGAYTIKVRDLSGGCESNNYGITAPLGVLLGISQTGLTHETCAGDNDGSITVGLQGDVQPYTVRLFRINGTTPTEVANSGAINVASHTFSNLQPGNYAVWVTNAAGCGEGLPAGFMGTGPYSGATLTINARPALAAAPVSTGPLINCYGNNGIITVNNTTGGQAPYEYSLNGGAYQSSNVLTGALASNNVFVRDVNQCVLGPLPVNIGLSPDNFTLDATATLEAPRTANCSDPGDPDFGRGVVSVNISGGTAPYEVKIIPASQNCQDHYNTVTPTNNTTLTFTALEAGDYIVCIRDAGGCIANRTITVPLLPALNISVTGVTNTACLEDDLTGSITFTASGGTAPYTVTLNNADPQTGNASSTFSYTGLAPGIYLLTLTDQRGCTFSTTRQVAALSGLSANVSQTDISPCSYSDNGVIEITPFGGIAPYTVIWLWDNTTATNVANNQMVQRSGLPIGSYSVRITDASGCLIQRDFGLTGPVEISAVLIPQDALCSTVANGTLTVNAIGGTGALSYSINGGPFQPDNVFSGLADGAYTLSIRDANLCTRQYPFNIGVVRTLTANATPTNPACFQTLTGSIAIAAVGGQQPYTYSLNGLAGPFLPALTGLGAGSYNILVSDADGCQVPISNAVQLTDPPLLTVSAVVTQDANCSANQGNLQATANGGTPNYSYVWDGNAALNAAVYNNALPGLHTVVVTDAKGCTATASATISNIPPIFLNLQGVTPEFCNRADGTATVQVTGGASPFNYTWSHNAGLNSPTATGLAAGTYSVTVSDLNNCTASVQNINITFTPAVTVNITEVKHSICDEGNGRITIAASAAPGPFSYVWSHNAGLNSPVADLLNSGSYSVTVTDGNNCSASVSATVLLRPRPVIQFVLLEDVTPAACLGNTGSVRVRIQPGTGTAPFNYTWSHNPGLNSSIAQNLTAGSYSCTVTDFYGCTAVLSTNVWELPPPQASVNTTTATCSLPNGSAQAQAFGGTAPYTYTWSNGAPNNPLAQNLSGGNYTLTVTDFFGCQAIVPFTIGNIAGPSNLNISFQNSICTPNNGNITVTPVGGTAPFQYLWSHNANLNSATASGLPAGAYSVTVTDATGCTISATQSILFQPPPVLTTLQQINSLCANGNGLIEVAAAGTGPFSYNWTGGVSTGPLAQNLNAGSYTVTVTDANGCTATRNFTIALEPSPAIQLLQQNNDICGRGLGRLRIRAILGQNPYSYTWSHNPGLNSDDATGLIAGTYTVTVTDANGCTATAQYVVTEIPGPNLSVANIGTAFCGNAVGTVSVQATGGLAPYTYSWSHNAGLNSASATGLLPGAYSVTVTDANQCTNTVQALVPGTPPVSVVLLNTGDNPCTANDASIAVSATGGTAPLSYAWSHNAGLNSPTATGLATGTYTVTVSDVHGCNAALTVMVTDRLGPQLAVAGVTNSTCGFADGAATVTASGGQPPYNFAWSHNAGLNSATASGLAAGNYAVTVTDANGCSASVSLVVSDSQGPQLVVQNSVNAVCTPDNGSLSVAATGGLPPYNYVWSHNPALNTSVATGLTPGSYGITVTDANGCTAAASGSVGFTPPPVATATVTDAYCQSNTGAISVAVAEGTAPYSIVWNIPSLSGFNPAPVFPGTYTAVITDANGCNAFLSATVNFFQGPVIVPVQQQSPVCGQANGLIQIGAIGGQEPFSYQWSHDPGLNFYIASNIPAGTYSVTVTDANGCQEVWSTVLPDAPGPTLSLTTTNSACGQNNGSLSANVSGGLAPLNYTWSHQPNLNSATAAGLAAGTYSVTVTDANGCTATAQGQVSDNGGLSLTVASFSNALCTPASGSISLNASGGTGPYSFVWSHDAGLSVPVATGLAAGTYSVTATDANGCTANISQTLSFAAGPALVLANTTNSLCQDGNGALSFSVSGGTAPFNYQWSHDPNLNAPASIGLSAGTYTLSVTDANGCTAVQSGQVGFTPGPQLSVAGQTDAYCDSPSGSVTLGVQGGVLPLQYIWSHDAGLNAPIATALGAGTYSATVTDANGCTASANTVVGDLPGFTLPAPITQVTACGAATGSIEVTPQGGQLPFQYQWSHDAGLNSATAGSLAVGIYTVTVTDALGCTRLATAEIQSADGPQLSISGIQNATCGDDNGSISVEAVGGTEPYAFIWSNGATNSTISNLAGGTYQVTVSDAADCQAVISAVISAAGAPVVQVTSTTPSACAQPTGSVSVSVSGGQGPYNYAWSHDSQLNDGTAANLSPGDYSVTVTDAEGCEASAQATITENADVELALLQTQAAQCASATGSATVSASGGQAPYNYVWSHDANLDNASATGLLPGTYSVTATDAGGCIETLSLVVESINTGFDLSVSQNTDTDCNQATGSLEFTAAGGQGPYTFNWSHDAGLSGNTATGLAVGEYFVTATDANGCTANLSAAVSEAGASSVTVQTTPSWCDQATGTATVPETGNFTYAWANSAQPGIVIATTATASNLSAGTYSVTVTNDQSCSAIRSFTIEDLPAMILTASATDAACFGQSTGTALATVTAGGAGSITYLWSNGLSGNALSGLSAGSYQVTATDANGCTATGTTTVSEPAALTVNPLSSTQPLCETSTNGSISVQVSGGTGSYTFQWETGQQTATITGLGAGEYRLTVSDANGCEASFQASLTAAGSLDVSVQTTSPDCAGQNSGQAVATPVGAGTYNYQWSAPGATNSNTADNLSPGAYSVTVSNAEGCVAVRNFVIEAAPVINLQATATPSCLNEINGAVSATAMGGAGGFTYQWSNGQQGAIQSALLPGIFTVTATDANGCTAEETVIVEGAPFPTLSIVDITSPDCAGLLPGSAQVAATGGTGMISYLWNDPLAQTTATAAQLLAGVYMVTATDENGCSGTITVEVEAPAGFTANVSALVQPACFGDNNGSATITVQGGSGDFSYQWSDPAGQNSAQALNLAAGSYTVSVTDNESGCSSIVPVNIANPVQLGLNLLNTSSVLCAGQSNGTAQVIGTGGVGIYTYIWNDPAGQTSPLAAGLSAGNYQVTVSDANGCTATTSVEIAEPQPLAAQISNFSAPLCFGANNGSALATVQGGTGIYSYQWNDPAGQTTAEAQNLPSGNYVVTVSDQNNCTTVANVSIPDVPQIVIAIEQQTAPACAGQTSGSISVSATGGTGTLAFNWSNGQSGNALSDLTSGAYTVSVTDANGCTQTLDINLDAPAALTLASSNVTPTTCYSGTDGAISVSVQGGTGTYTYLWSDAAVQTASEAVALARGSYTVTATDGNGCTLVSNFSVGSQGAQIFLTPGAVSTDCLGASNGAATINASGGAGSFSFVWSNGQTGTTLSNLASGAYSVTATDAAGCTETAVADVLSGAPISVDLGPADSTLCEGEVLFVDFTGTGYTVQWTSQTGFTSQDLLTALDRTDTYYLQVSNALGCTARDTISLIVATEPLQAFFVIATDVVVGSEVAAVEASWPIPQEVEWFFAADSVEFVRREGDQYIFRFLQTGQVRLGMRGVTGNCEDFIYKLITVHADSTTIPGLNPDAPDILGVTVAPNPNDGQFSVQVELSGPKDIILSLYNANGVIQERRIRRGQSEYDEAYIVTGQPGTYFLMVQSPKQRRVFTIQVVGP